MSIWWSGLVVVVSMALPGARADEFRVTEALEKLGARINGGRLGRGGPINAVDLSGTKVTSEGLKALAPLKRLETLSLARTKVGYLELKELGGQGRSADFLHLSSIPATIQLGSKIAQVINITLILSFMGAPARRILSP